MTDHDRDEAAAVRGVKSGFARLQNGGMRLLASQIRRFTGTPETAGPRLPVEASQAKRVLVVHLGGIGDSVLLTPFLRELRRFLPTAHVELLVRRESQPLFESSPYVDHASGLNFITQKALRLVVQPVTAMRMMQSRRADTYDLALLPRWDVDDNLASAYIAMSGARLRVGYTERANPRKQQLNAGFDNLLSHAVHFDGPVHEHEVNRNLRLLRAIGAEPDSDRLELWPTDRDIRGVDAHLGEHGDHRPLVALGIGAFSDRRIWPLDKFIALGRALTDQGARVLVIGGPTDAENQAILCQAIGNGAIGVAGLFSLAESYVAIKRCVGFVGNDSGPLHLAATAKTPSVEISCHPLGGRVDHANSPQRFGPWRVNATVVQPPAALKGCDDGCAASYAHCIATIRVDVVLEACRQTFAAGLSSVTRPVVAQSSGR